MILLLASRGTIHSQAIQDRIGFSCSHRCRIVGKPGGTVHVTIQLKEERLKSSMIAGSRVGVYNAITMTTTCMIAEDNRRRRPIYLVYAVVESQVLVVFHWRRDHQLICSLISMRSESTATSDTFGMLCPMGIAHNPIHNNLVGWANQPCCILINKLFV